MYTIYVLTISSLKMFVRNRQALFFSLFMPMVVLLIFGSMSFDRQTPPVVGLVKGTPNSGAQDVIDQLKKNTAITVKDQGTLDGAKAALKAGDLSAIVQIPDDLSATPQITLFQNQSQQAQAGMVASALGRIMLQKTMESAHVPPAFTIQPQALNSTTSRYIDFLLPGIIAMSVMQMSVFSVAFVFARYREQGILKRVLATPVKPYQFVTANILSRLVMSIAQASIFAIVGVVAFHVQIHGAIWLLALCVVLGSIMFLGLGFTISGLAKTIETVPVYSNLIVFPMLFLGNVFFPVNNSPPWLKPIAANLPLTYFSEALRAVMTDGAGILQVKWSLLGTFCWAVALVALATFTFRMQDAEST